MNDERRAELLRIVERIEFIYRDYGPTHPNHDYLKLARFVQEVLSARPVEEAPAENLRMDAYYYGFTYTGQPLVDRVLSAVACAGKAYHNTADWSDETEPYEPCFRGDTPVDWIQSAADDVARHIDALSARPASVSSPSERVEIQDVGRDVNVLKRLVD